MGRKIVKNEDKRMWRVLRREIRKRRTRMLIRKEEEEEEEMEDSYNKHYR